MVLMMLTLGCAGCDKAQAQWALGGARVGEGRWQAGVPRRVRLILTVLPCHVIMSWPPPVAL